MPIHTPILSKTICEVAKAYPGGAFLDCTTGEGGHSQALLETIESLSLLCLDRDGEILQLARKRLSPWSSQVDFINQEFSQAIPQFSEQNKRFDFILMDLGISSYHFEASHRGFSFQNDERLDMRLTVSNPISAYDVLNQFPQDKLADIIYEYGEEKRSRLLARKIVAKRPWQSSKQLADAIASWLEQKNSNSKNRQKRQSKHIHPATRTFQAIRIFVNNELECLQQGLDSIPNIIKPGGLLAVISFHSLEDRIAKWFMRYWQNPFMDAEFIPVPFLKQKIRHLQALSPKVSALPASLGTANPRKPILPSSDEMSSNPRSRSAKLRLFHFQTDNYKEG